MGRTQEVLTRVLDRETPAEAFARGYLEGNRGYGVTTKCARRRRKRRVPEWWAGTWRGDGSKPMDVFKTGYLVGYGLSTFVKHGDWGRTGLGNMPIRFASEH